MEIVTLLLSLLCVVKFGETCVGCEIREVEFHHSACSGNINHAIVHYDARLEG